jgi:hypothetical protein
VKKELSTMFNSNDRKQKMKLWQTTQINTQTGVKTSGVSMSADSCSIITTTGRSQQSNKGHNESDSQGEPHS